ncbi:hypothetical protein OE88DRAFT_1788708 [Heliocybe sulcata]|uniref:F-box domain-containing protein n=1 Tax=Heliocybe sulcata TaxID=5364 RepID=A0A5C3MJJ5_9AGAM|nr:hypothetical protein OE88DRAFT_1788708 [Heliocybe sulcata]
MHKSLRILEILAAIARHIDDDADQCEDVAMTERAASLHAMAVTCKAFVDPALTVLWRQGSSLGDLVRCMPEDLWSRDAAGHIHLQRPIRQSDWDRFHYYAMKVQSIRIGCNETRTTILALNTENGPLLPNLRELTWDISRNNPGLTYISSFLSPGLRRLTLQLGVAPSLLCHDARYFLDLIQIAAPLLKEIIFVHCPNNTSSQKIPLIAGGLQLDRLRTFRWPTPLTKHDVGLLGTLPHLEVLEIYMMPRLEASPDTRFALLSKDSYPALRQLVLKAHYLEHCLNFIDALQSSRIQILELACEDISYDGLGRLDACLNGAGSTSSLRVFRISGYAGNNPDHPAPWRALTAFSSAKHLEELDIGLKISFALEDDFIQELVVNWPRLKYLRLGISPFSSRSMYGGGPSLQSLVHIANNCPLLTSLIMSVDDVPDTTLSVEAMQPYATNLQSLHVGSSHIHDPVRAAMLLSKLFPRLTVVTGLNRNDGKSELWRIVQDTVRLIAQVRKEEQARLVQNA